MILFSFIIPFILLVSVSAVPKNTNDISYEVKLPIFMTTLLGIDKSWRTFRATLGSLDGTNNTNDRVFSLIATNASDAERYGRPRSQHEHNLMRVNIKGINDAAAGLSSLLKPMAEIGTKALLRSIMGSVRRTDETRPNVELAPGTFKTEILTYPKNFLEKRLKHLLKIQKQKDLNG